MLTVAPPSVSSNQELSPSSTPSPSNASTNLPIELVYGLCQRELGSYGIAVHGLRPAHVHEQWIGAITDLVSGRLEHRKLLIIAPPGHAKSTWTSLVFPTWYLGNHPDQSLLFFTSSDTMARQFGGAVKAVLEGSEAHAAIFPDSDARPDAGRGWSTDGLYLRGVPAGSKDPAYRALGYGASVVGSRAHGVILDDPLSQSQAESLTEQETAIRYWDMTVSRRLHPEGWAIAIMTRWHETDLAARLQDKGDWAILHLSTEGATQSLWPERFPVEWLQAEQRSMGGPIYACVYDGDPTSLGGDLFRDSYFQPWPRNVQFNELTRVMYVDTAWSEKQTADYTAACVLGFHAGFPERYVLGVARHRVDDRDLAAHLADLIGLYRPSAVGIEEAAYKQARTRQLVGEIRALLDARGLSVAVRSVTVDRDKIARARPASARGEAGQLFANRQAPWFPEFVAECTGFPRRAHDDQVDALAGAELMATQHGALHLLAEATKTPMQVQHSMPGAPAPKKHSELEVMLGGLR